MSQDRSSANRTPSAFGMLGTLRTSPACTSDQRDTRRAPRGHRTGNGLRPPVCCNLPPTHRSVARHVYRTRATDSGRCHRSPHSGGMKTHPPFSENGTSFRLHVSRSAASRRLAHLCFLGVRSSAATALAQPRPRQKGQHTGRQLTVPPVHKPGCVEIA